MAVYHGSAFGTLSGKALGVVAGTWKGTQYVRAYVKPSNPDTQAQKEVRSLFGDVAKFGKLLVGIWLNEMTAPKPKKQSAYNVFVRRNVDKFKGQTFDPENMVLSEGSLPLPATTTVTASKASGIELTFSTEVTGDARDDDIVGLLVYDTTETVFASATAARSAGTLTVQVPAAMAENDALKMYVVVVSKTKEAGSDQRNLSDTLSA